MARAVRHAEKVAVLLVKADRPDLAAFMLPFLRAMVQGAAKERDSGE